MKVFDETAQTAAELKMELRLVAQADGVISEDEARLIDLADRTYAWSEIAAHCQRFAIRAGNGGALDERMLREWQDIQVQIAALLDKTPRLIRLPATASGSGSHGGKGNGLTFTRKANGSTRLVRRG